MKTTLLILSIWINSAFANIFMTGQGFSCPEKSLKKIDADIIFIGENHFDGLSGRFIANNLKTFKQLGFEYFFAEYIESNDQTILDKFNKNPSKYERNILLTFGGHGDWGYDTNKYFSLSKSIAKHGMKLMGLDRRSDLRFMVNQGRKMAIRDRHMFEVAEDFIKNNPGKKLIFFNGWSHSFINDVLVEPSFYELFKNKFPKLKILNLKRDFYEEISKERLELSNRYLSLDMGCPSDFIFYEGDNDFDYYIFEQDEPLFPLSDSYTSDFV